MGKLKDKGYKIGRTFIYEVIKPFKHKRRSYKPGDFVYQLEGLPKSGIGPLVDGQIIQPIPKAVYSGKIEPYQNRILEKVLRGS